MVRAGIRMFFFHRKRQPVGFQLQDGRPNSRKPLERTDAGTLKAAPPDKAEVRIQRQLGKLNPNKAVASVKSNPLRTLEKPGSAAKSKFPRFLS